MSPCRGRVPAWGRGATPDLRGTAQTACCCLLGSAGPDPAQCCVNIFTDLRNIFVLNMYLREELVNFGLSHPNILHQVAGSQIGAGGLPNIPDK